MAVVIGFQPVPLHFSVNLLRFIFRRTLKRLLKGFRVHLKILTIGPTYAAPKKYHPTPYLCINPCGVKGILKNKL
jgi:hypothetical protein